MAEQEMQKRQVAHKIRLNDILEGRYVKEDGIKPNYVLLKNGNQVSRVNVIGTVINSQTDPATRAQTITIDDGSGKITVRSFDAAFSFQNAAPGSTVNLLGKVREFGNERYLMPEIIKPILRSWVAVRKMELELNDAKDMKRAGAKKQAEEQYADFEEEIVMENQYLQIIDLIKKSDSANGADTEEIILKSNVEDAEKKIRTLLEEGEIYEIKPGRLKVLE